MLGFFVTILTDTRIFGAHVMWKTEGGWLTTTTVIKVRAGGAILDFICVTAACTRDGRAPETQSVLFRVLEQRVVCCFF